MVSSTYLKAKIVATQEAAEKSTREGMTAIPCPANKKGKLALLKSQESRELKSIPFPAPRDRDKEQQNVR